MASPVKSIILDKVLRQMTKGSTLGGFMDLDFKEKQFTKSRCPFSLSRTLNANSLCLSLFQLKDLSPAFWEELQFKMKDKLTLPEIL